MILQIGFARVRVRDLETAIARYKQHRLGCTKTDVTGGMVYDDDWGQVAFLGCDGSVQLTKSASPAPAVIRSDT